MNFLAHAYLARYSDEAMLGALLGDFAKADMLGLYPPTVVLEIMLHRQVDSYTDSHPVVLAGKALFAPERRRYAGIVLDVFYDHLLAANWPRYSDEALDDFTRRFYRALAQHHATLPPRLQAIAPSIIAHDWLGSYRSMDNTAHAIGRIAGRLSRNGDLLRDGVLDLHAHYDALAAGFAVFFPELIRFVEEKRAALLRDMAPA
ncbi:Acyl carrier protein phosphodiesterase [Andreprevotia sp. IGB-42]|uniref:acyl carrier protein phosphodiesterase n=1 Tax=Andreprevotia sp. IGB-42 TaxID=2497473 RepID=UPI00135A3DC5|nr:ACP phosphodiesterase [Andreprevotia sp. IGB-42]KAF0811395.1 Acyl carrier protein phosphodiesterase [Andreprevotia sp. IGB-42]